MQIQPKKVKPGIPDVIQTYKIRKCLEHYPSNGQVFMQEFFRGDVIWAFLQKRGQVASRCLITTAAFLLEES